MRPIDADAIVSIQTFDEMYEEWNVETMSVAEALDRFSDEGCPPTLDYAPVRHGEWVKDHSYTRKNFELYYCTVCNHWQKCSIKTPSMNVLHMKYCPWCGAKMDAKED